MRRGNCTNEDNPLRILAIHMSTAECFLRYFKELYASCDCPAHVRLESIPAAKRGSPRADFPSLPEQRRHGVYLISFGTCYRRRFSMAGGRSISRGRCPCTRGRRGRGNAAGLHGPPVRPLPALWEDPLCDTARRVGRDLDWCGTARPGAGPDRTDGRAAQGFSASRRTGTAS